MNEENFNWKQYILNYSDLYKIRSKKEALFHWNKIGNKQNRTDQKRTYIKIR